MRTDLQDEKPASVFLFAHQDDECGVYEHIHRAVSAGHHVVCAYFTTGVPDQGDSTRRDEESRSVLLRLGVEARNVIYVGTQLGIADGTLIQRLDDASEWIAHWLKESPSNTHIYAPAWEGGHPDHDALHAMVVHLTQEAAGKYKVFQFALYNGLNCPGPWFRLLSPLPTNGASLYVIIPWGRRLEYARLTLSYPSQWRTWIGLFPAYLTHLLFYGWHALQPVSPARLFERPHLGTLYYEKRKFSTWETVNARLAKWANSRPSQRHQ